MTITLGSGPTHPTPTHPPSPPPPPPPPKATSPDGPDNPLPDPGPHVPKATFPYPDPPGGPQPNPDGPPPPKWPLRGSTVTYLGETYIVDDIRGGFVVCYFCGDTHPAYALHNARRTIQRAPGCLIKASVVAEKPLAHEDAGDPLPRVPAAAVDVDGASAAASTFRDRMEAAALRLVGAR